MPAPPMKDIYIGTVFVLFGLVKVMCDRWQKELIVQGTPTRKPHAFDHTFVMWFLKQLMQFGLLFLWMAIDKNWLGFSRFRHGEVNQRGEDQANQRVVEILAGAPDNRDHVGMNVEEDDGNIQQENHHPQVNAADDNERANRAENNGEEEAPTARLVINDDADNNDDVANDANAGDGNDAEEEDRVLQFPPAPAYRPRVRRQKKYTKLLYFPPAFFHVSFVLLTYFGMQLTYSSSFGMLKGTVAFFTALLSMAFLAQQLPFYVWFGVVVATLGFGALGISDYVHNTPDGFEKYGIAAGDLQIGMGQIMFATKLIYEEKFIRKHSIHPMKFLGSEASYGFAFATILLIIFNLVDGVQYTEMPNGHIEDFQDAAFQLAADWRVVLAFVGSLLSYIVYTYLGLFLVRDQGALPRIMVELLVWAFYWGICLALHWEQFFIAQVPGFVLILKGILVYAHILVIPCFNCCQNDEVIGLDDDMPLDGNDDLQDGEDDDRMLDLVHDADNGMEVGENEDDALFLADHEDGDENPFLGVQ
ncbi:uncharacterized protein LOC101858271 isoform X2 [Aplysia californica]|uniref:Uncharacterized protein LOC101858271 isoform X2 n=1 Tax=Aplysia californica TaxID=6500 RepID=A0ABM1VTS5_APLCA|nr:uncharacterized protein LOC101858271 isoform X2 [Aplysia californica]